LDYNPVFVFLNYPQLAHWRFLRVVDVEPFVF